MASAIFSKMSLRQFSWISILFCILGDISISGHIYSRFNQFDLFRDTYGQVIRIIGHDPSIFPPEFVREQFGLMMQMLATMLILFIIMHICIYLFYYFKKRVARGYIILLCWLAIPGTFFLFIASLGSGSWLGHYFLLQTFFYLFALLGIKYFYRKPSEMSERPGETLPDRPMGE